MKRFAILIFILPLLCTFAYSQYTLHIEVTGIKDTVGVIMLQLLNAHEEVVGQAKGSISNSRSEMSITNLPPGRYAIRYYQDKNLNGQLDKNMLGIPIEGYGFSRNAYGMFGPKPLKEWLFEINEDKKLTMRIKY